MSQMFFISLYFALLFFSINREENDFGFEYQLMRDRKKEKISQQVLIDIFCEKFEIGV